MSDKPKPKSRARKDKSSIAVPADPPAPPPAHSPAEHADADTTLAGAAKAVSRILCFPPKTGARKFARATKVLAAPAAPPFPAPADPAALAAFLRTTLGISVPGPTEARDHGHTSSPLDYLAHAFFEGRRFTHPDPLHDSYAPTDCVVWANRGGGKTFLGAVATMLDLVFKPGIQVRILGGSLEQSRRMQDHLHALFAHPALAPLVRRGPNATGTRRLLLTNGSRAEILAASETSVRGVRVQKVRCDEVDLFDPALWRAVQLTTRSIPCPGPWGATVRGTIEALSTMHRPFGLMWDLTRAGAPAFSGSSPKGEVAPKATVGATAFSTPPSVLPSPPSSSSVPSSLAPSPLLPSPSSRLLFRWGIIDALEFCGPQHHCDTCNLFDDCRGRAKAIPPEASGHIRIADARAQKSRVDIETWRSEMLCLEPRTHDLVYPEFDPRIHIFGLASDDATLAPFAPAPSGPVDALAPEFLVTHRPSSSSSGSSPQGEVSPQATVGAPVSSTLSSAFPSSSSGPPKYWLAGMDFGFRADTAILLARIDDSGTIWIERESIARQRILGRHIDTLLAWLAPLGGPRALRFLAADPAGNADNQQSGRDNIDLIRASGLTVRTRASTIEAGLKLVRARLAPAAGGPPRLLVHARCTGLIDCLRRYHYEESDGRSLIPAKGEFDHACDALRYMIAMHDAGLTGTRTGRW